MLFRVAEKAQWQCRIPPCLLQPALHCVSIFYTRGPLVRAKMQHRCPLLDESPISLDSCHFLKSRGSRHLFYARLVLFLMCIFWINPHHKGCVCWTWGCGSPWVVSRLGGFHSTYPGWEMRPIWPEDALSLISLLCWHWHLWEKYACCWKGFLFNHLVPM